MRDPSSRRLILPWTNYLDIQKICDSFPALLDVSPLSLLFVCAFVAIAVFLCSFGYRFHRLSSFLATGLLGTAFFYLLCSAESVFEFYIDAAIGIGCGLLCAIIASLHSKLGFFISGFSVGAIVGAYCVIAISILTSFNSVLFGLSVCFLLGIFVALLSINWEKTFSISNTSFVSGFLIFLAVDYLVEQFVLVHYGWVILIQAKTPAICSYSWVAAAVWPIVSIIGIFFQSLRTGRYYDHREPKDPADESDENDTPRKSMNSTLRIGKTATPEGVGTKTTKSTLRQTSTTRYTGDIVPKNLTGNNALPATMHTAARMRAMAAAQNAGGLAAGLPMGMDLGPEYQVMGSTVYYGDTYSEYGVAARQMGGPLAQTVPGLGGPQKVRRGPGKQRQKSNANDSLYEDVDDEDQYCAIDYDQIRNYEYGYAQYGSQYGGPQYGGPPGGQVDAQQLLMMQQQQQQQIYRQQQSRTNTLGSTRSDGGGAGVYQRVPTQAPGMSGGGPVYQPINSQDSDVGASRHTVDAMQMDNMKRSGSPALLNGGGKMNAAATPLGPKSTPLMARGPTRAPPPPPTQTGPSNDEDYLSPVTSNTSNV